MYRAPRLALGQLSMIICKMPIYTQGGWAGQAMRSYTVYRRSLQSVHPCKTHLATSLA